MVSMIAENSASVEGPLEFRQLGSCLLGGVGDLADRRAEVVDVRIDLVGGLRRPLASATTSSLVRVISVIGATISLVAERHRLGARRRFVDVAGECQVDGQLVRRRRSRSKDRGERGLRQVRCFRLASVSRPRATIASIAAARSAHLAAIAAPDTPGSAIPGVATWS